MTTSQARASGASARRSLLLCLVCCARAQLTCDDRDGCLLSNSNILSTGTAETLVQPAEIHIRLPCRAVTRGAGHGMGMMNVVEG